VSTSGGTCATPGYEPAKGLTSKNRQQGQRKNQLLWDMDGVKVWLQMAVT